MARDSVVAIAVSDKHSMYEFCDSVIIYFLNTNVLRVIALSL